MRIPADRDNLLAELESRQDEVLEQLAALESQLEKLLAEFAPAQAATPQAMPAAA